MAPGLLLLIVEAVLERSGQSCVLTVQCRLGCTLVMLQLRSCQPQPVAHRSGVCQGTPALVMLQGRRQSLPLQQHKIPAPGTPNPPRRGTVPGALSQTQQADLLVGPFTCFACIVVCNSQSYWHSSTFLLLWSAASLLHLWNQVVEPQM